MSSIVPGFEYDIFISYRHKDNKYDGWVMEFIDKLKKEIEATFKEDISIYFDVNLHDGLQETHDVDGSLKDKLKCLIFIPIISRTYCDVKSFAWNKEFLQFLKSASTDDYGLKVRLPNGNIASRVLPIRIHELDTDDKQMIETELQGPLRAIDFTFQTAGVNRPLRPKDDESIKGSNQISYRDQINKTANAISDLIAGLRSNGQVGIPSTISENTSQSDIESNRIPKRNWKFQMPLFKISSTAIALVISVLSFIALALIHFSEPPPENSTYRSTILPSDKTNISTIFGNNSALSPDGQSLAFVATDSTGAHLWVRKLNSPNAQMLENTDGAHQPFWSPDSHFIGFAAEQKLKKIEATGGPSQTICDVAYFRGGTWNEDGTIVFSNNSFAGLSRVSSAGGPVTQLTKLDTAKEVSHRWPFFLPDGEHFLFTSKTNANVPTEQDAIFLASLDTTIAPRWIVNASSNAAYANGYLLFAHDQTLMAQAFDKSGMHTSGDAFPIAERVFFNRLTSMSAFTVSQNGTLVYQISLLGSSGLQLIWLDRTGKQTGVVKHISNLLNSFRISPDGKRLAISYPDGNGKNIDTWLYDIDRSLVTRLTFNDAMDHRPIWSPDGRMIVFASNRNNKQSDLYMRATDGAGNEELLHESPNGKLPSDWSRDGMFIAFHSSDFSKAGTNDLWILPLDRNLPVEERKPFAFLKTEFDEMRSVFSPDGRWIAYQSSESGRMEVYIRPFPGPGGKWQVSTLGGSRPRWRADGKELFFMVNDSKLMAAEIKLGTADMKVDKVKSLFEVRIYTAGGRDLYDVTPDGQKFLVESTSGAALSSPFTLVVNWPGEIKSK